MVLAGAKDFQLSGSQPAPPDKPTPFIVCYRNHTIRFNGAAAVMLRNTTWTFDAADGVYKLQWGRSSYAAEYIAADWLKVAKVAASMGPQQLCCGILRPTRMWR